MEDMINENAKLKERNRHLEAQMRRNSCMIYHSDKKDKIDEKLGEFINNFPEREKLKILFIRESEGVYQFGQRRVYIKCEKGGQIMVRVGGGFVPVQDFID